MDRDTILLNLAKARVSWPQFHKLLKKYPVEALPLLDKKELPVEWQEDLSCELEEKEIGYITCFSPLYPERLKKLKNYPYVLFYRGDLSLLNKRMAAVVGSRKATLRGKEFSYRVSLELAASGYVVVSGMAAGIDTHAHRGALSAGTTVAVLGTSVDVVYPKSNYRLFEEVCEKGLVISPFYPSTSAYRYNFPLRNGIIAALSEFVVVVEAALKSGALITARYAMEMGIPVYAVPGRISDVQSKGTNWLIKQGARLLDSVEELPAEKAVSEDNVFDEQGCSELEKSLLDLISSGIGTVEELAQKLNKDVNTLQRLLLELEIKGLVVRRFGGVYERI